MRKEFRPHQIPMYEYFMATKHPALLVEMRLGKTLVTIRGLVDKGCQYIMVVAPINAMVAWKDQLTEEGEHFIEAYALTPALRNKRVMEALNCPHRVWLLINYESLKTVSEIVSAPWDAVVADESVKLKNPKSKISTLFGDNFGHVPCKVILTGLIAPESALDIYQQFKFLYGKFMNKLTYWKWRAEYFQPDATGYNWVPMQGSSKLIKKVMHERAFILSRKQAGVERKKYYTVRTVSMTPEQKKMYQQVEKEFSYDYAHTLREGTHYIADETLWATGKGLWLQRIAGGFTPDGKVCINDAKIKEIHYLLTNDLINESVVIWYRFRAELLYDLTYLSSRGIECAYMIGRGGKDGAGMTVKQAEQQENDFKQGKKRVMLCMQKLGAYAKDFSIASTTIYRSNEHSCDLRAQSEDRTLSLGKEGGLMVIDMATEGTNDLATIDTVKMKKFNAKFLLSDSYERAIGKRNDKLPTKPVVFCSD